MFRPVRKKKNEIDLQSAKQVLHTARHGILAMNGEDGYPYSIPVNYVYSEDENKLFFHSAKAGYKVDLLKKCDKICFTVCGEEDIREEEWAPFTKSVVIFGRCKPVLDRDEKIRRVKQFAMKYYPSENLADIEIADAGNAVQMYEIEIEHLTGKEVHER